MTAGNTSFNPFPNNLLCFKTYDGRQLCNTEVRELKLPIDSVDENDFEELFEEFEVQKRVYTDGVKLLKRSDYWVEGVDVATGMSPSKVQYVWVRKHATNSPNEYLVYMYKRMKDAQARYEKTYKEWQETCNNFKRLCPKDMTIEEWLATMMPSFDNTL